MNRWIGAKDDFHRVRCSTQDFCSHVSRRVRFRVQGRPLFPAAKPLSMLEWMVTMLWIQLQAEGRMQSNTDKLCNSLHLSSEYLAKLQPNISRHGTHWLLGHRSEEIYALHSQQWRHIPTDENWYKHHPIFQLYHSTRPLLGHSTSSKCLHYHQTIE